jgi:hypothetical protein
MPYTATIIALIILAIVFSSPRKRWKCPACDFSVEQDKEGLAKAHTLLHVKHQPALKDE